MKNIFTVVLLTAFTFSGMAQQAAQYSMYMWNKHAFNPAYAGLDNSLSITGVYRNQWVNLPGSPVTQTVNAHMPLYLVGGGVGLAFENESLGSWTQTTANLSYDYQMVVNNLGVLSLGLSAGITQRKFDGRLARAPEGNFDTDVNGEIIYKDHGPIENVLPLTLETGIAPVVNIGAFYQGEKLEAGISATNLLENEINLSTISFVPERTYYFYTGYKLDLGRKLQITPSLLVKSDIFQTQIDFSLIAQYNENIFGGATFRGYDSNSIDAVSIIGGIKLNEKITIGYAYDLTLSGLSNVNNGTHEVLINYNLGKPIGQGKPPIIIYNPRSL